MLTLQRFVALFAMVALFTAPLAHARGGDERGTLGNDLAVGAVVSVGVATVVAGGAMLGGADAGVGLAVFAAVTSVLAGVQLVIRAITSANEDRAIVGSNVARSASTTPAGASRTREGANGAGRPR